MVLGVLVVYFVFDFGLGYSDCRVCRFWFALFICLVVGLLGCVFWFDDAFFLVGYVSCFVVLLLFAMLVVDCVAVGFVLV